MAAGAEVSLGEKLALHAVGVFFQHLHVDHAVVHQHDITHMNVVHETVVVHIHRELLLALRAANGEFKNVTGLEIELRREVPSADRGALRIKKNAAVRMQPGGDTANALHHITHPIVPGVAHVQAENIRAREDQIPDHNI